MTSTQTIKNTLVSANTDDLPSPDAANAVGATTPDVTDSGRISFGACARHPSSTALPRPTGTEQAVADSGRIGFGACARHPVSK